MPSLQHTLVSLVVGRLRRNPPVEDLPALRAQLVAENRSHPEGPPKAVRRGHAEHLGNDHGFPVVSLWHEQREEPPTRAVLYVHGGGYVHPSDPKHWSFATRLADELGARAVLPLYPLAPEFTHADSFAALVEVLEETIAACPDGVVLAGDSAGGGYALALAQELRDRGGARPERLVLMAPWVDLTGETPGTREAAARDPWLSYPHLAVYGSFWAGTTDRAAMRAPRLSPLYGDLAGLPPTLMLCGTRDLLQPGCDALFDRAEEADWPLTYVVAPGLVHVYPLLPIPEARAAFATIVEFCRGG